MLVLLFAQPVVRVVSLRAEAPSTVDGTYGLSLIPGEFEAGLGLILDAVKTRLANQP